MSCHCGDPTFIRNGWGCPVHGEKGMKRVGEQERAMSDQPSVKEQCEHWLYTETDKAEMGCPWCKIERLERELRDEREAHAQLQARCFDSGGSQSVFDRVAELKRENATMRAALGRGERGGRLADEIAASAKGHLTEPKAFGPCDIQFGWPDLYWEDNETGRAYAWAEHHRAHRRRLERELAEAQQLLRDGGSVILKCHAERDAAYAELDAHKATACKQCAWRERHDEDCEIRETRDCTCGYVGKTGDLSPALVDAITAPERENATLRTALGRDKAKTVKCLEQLAWHIRVGDILDKILSASVVDDAVHYLRAAPETSGPLQHPIECNHSQARVTCTRCGIDLTGQRAVEPTAGNEFAGHSQILRAAASEPGGVTHKTDTHETAQPAPPPPASRAVCPGCGNEIDPETCECGDPIKGHSYISGHGPVPMGCDCMRDQTPSGQHLEYETY